MKRRVVWSEDARADVRDLVAYLSLADTGYTDRLIDAIERCGNALGELDTGRPGRVAGTREKSISRIGYILSYRVDRKAGTVVILRVIHGRRDWPKGRWPADS